MINIEVFYHPSWEKWVVMPVDENERSAGDKSCYRLKSDAMQAAREHNLPIHIFSKSGELQCIRGRVDPAQYPHPAQKKTIDRNVDVFVSRSVHGETYKSIGARHSISSERARQIFETMKRRIEGLM